MLRFDGAGRSDVGLVRRNNEDSGFAGPYLQLVADGVGGAASGEVASATAAYVVAALALRAPSADPLTTFADAVRVIHDQLRLGVDRDPSRSGMGSTLTALLTDGERVALAQVGDSRAYRLRDGVLAQLSRDQTFVQMLVDEGVLLPAQARRHPRKNVVMQALGAERPAVPEIELVDVRRGDRLLICSDGLSDLVDDDAIASALTRADPDDAAAELVRVALAAGGLDNVTCVVADVVDGPWVDPVGLHLGAFRDPGLVVDPAAVRPLPA
jgi:serine/threonine protein phosphatase PrpC